MTTYRYVFTTRIRLRTGRVLYAWQYGKRAFRIRVRDQPPRLTRKVR